MCAPEFLLGSSCLVVVWKGGWEGGGKNWDGSGCSLVLHLLQEGRAFILNLAGPLEQCMEILQILINTCWMNEFADDLLFIYIVDIYNQWERQLELTRQESLSNQFISYCCHHDIFCFLKQPCSCWHWDNKYFDNENPLY